MNRRQFLKTGLAGGAALAAAGTWYGLSGGNATEEDAMLAAVANVILEGMLPTNPDQRRLAIQEAVAGTRGAVAKLSAATQAEVAQLFALLCTRAGRVMVAGVWPKWANATPDDVAAFLTGWRYSRFDLLRSGYAAMRDLVFGGWYANSQNWAAIGYPGPPKLS